MFLFLYINNFFLFVCQTWRAVCQKGTTSIFLLSLLLLLQEQLSFDLPPVVQRGASIMSQSWEEQEITDGAVVVVLCDGRV